MNHDWPLSTGASRVQYSKNPPIRAGTHSAQIARPVAERGPPDRATPSSTSRAAMTSTTSRPAHTRGSRRAARRSERRTNRLAKVANAATAVTAASRSGVIVAVSIAAACIVSSSPRPRSRATNVPTRLGRQGRLGLAPWGPARCRGPGPSTGAAGRGSCDRRGYGRRGDHRTARGRACGDRCDPDRRRRDHGAPWGAARTRSRHRREVGSCRYAGASDHDTRVAAADFVVGGEGPRARGAALCARYSRNTFWHGS